MTSDVTTDTGDSPQPGPPAPARVKKIARSEWPRILERYEKGENAVQIAPTYGVCANRILQIVKRLRNRQATIADVQRQVAELNSVLVRLGVGLEQAGRTLGYLTARLEELTGGGGGGQDNATPAAQEGRPDAPGAPDGPAAG
jgi:hypothetical protein